MSSLTGTVLKSKSADGKTKLYGTMLSAQVSLQPLGVPVTATLSMPAYNGTGVAGLTVALEPAEADPRYTSWEYCQSGESYRAFTCTRVTLPDGTTAWRLLANEPVGIPVGPFKITDLLAGWNFSTHQFTFQAGLQVGSVLPSPPAEDELSSENKQGGKVFMVGGRLGPKGIEALNFGGTLGLEWGPFDLQKLTLEYQRSPFSVGGEVEADVLKDAEFLKIFNQDGVSVHGGLRYTQGAKSGFDLRIEGPVPLFDLPIQGYVELDTRDGRFSVLLGGNFSEHWTWAGIGVDANFGVDGAVQVVPSLHVQVAGHGDVTAFGVTAQAQVLLSDAGIGICGSTSVLGVSFEIGISHNWESGDTQTQGCDFSGLYTVQGATAHDAAAGTSVTIRRGQPREEIVAVGAAAAPGVVLTGPDGARVSTPAVPNRVQVTGHVVALAVPGSHATYFFLEHPAAGRWHIAPNPGGPAPARYELAGPLAPLGLRASVVGSGHRRVLRWEMNAQRGVSVEFLQSGGVESQILTTGRSHGSVRFPVAPGPGGHRFVTALVSVDGTLRQRVNVARFRAAAPRAPTVPYATYRVTRGTLHVGWGHARGASVYLITLHTGQGSAQYRLSSRADVFTLPLTRLSARTGVKSVGVTAVSSGSLSGPEVKAVRQALRRRHTPPRGRSRPRRHGHR